MTGQQWFHLTTPTTTLVLQANGASDAVSRGTWELTRRQGGPVVVRKVRLATEEEIEGAVETNLRK